jgi:hypothetical protein
VATLAIATATTATVAATDPVNVWSDPDPHTRPAANTRATHTAPPATTASASAGSVLPQGQAAYHLPPARSRNGPRVERGRAFGQATAAAAKNKSKNAEKGKEKGKAVERTKPTGSNGNGVRAQGTPNWAGQSGPPPHAKANSGVKQKDAKKSA